jgi:hypothetical protein
VNDPNPPSKSNPLGEDGLDVRFEPVQPEDRAGPVPERTERLIKDSSRLSHSNRPMVLNDPAVDVLLPKPRRKWRRRTAFLLFVALLVLGWFAPQLLAMWSWGREATVATILSKTPERVTVERAEWSWLANPVLWDVAIRSTENESVFEAGQIRFRQPLWQLAWQPSRLGEVSVWSPHVRFQLRDGRLVGPETLPRRTTLPKDLQLNVQDGQLDLVDSPASEDAPPLVSVRDIALDLALSDDPDRELPFRFTGSIEPGEVAFEGHGRFDAGREVVQLVLLEAKSQAQAWAVLLSGQVSGPPTQYAADLHGEWTGGLARFSDLWRGRLPVEITLHGSNALTFDLNAKLENLAALPSHATWREALPFLSGTAKPMWDRAEIGEVTLGRGAADVTLKDGVLTVEAANVPCGSGWVHVRGGLELTGSEPALVFPAGPVLEDIAVTPRMSAEWLKFAAPVVANATEIGGQVSLALEPGRVPLVGESMREIAQSADVSGRLSLKNVEVGSGPLVKLFAETLALPAKIQLVDDAHVQFRLHSGRLHHRGLAFKIGRVGIVTEGSVGLDESIDIVASIQVPRDSLLPNQIMQALAGRTLRLPVVGTLGEPRVDLARLTQLNFGSSAEAEARPPINPLEAPDEEENLLDVGAYLLLGDEDQAGLIEILGRLRGEPDAPASPTTSEPGGWYREPPMPSSGPVPPRQAVPTPTSPEPRP